MSRLLYKTIADERPQGKPNVYFACHPDDLGVYFDEYAARILKIQDCAIWYESEPEADFDREDLELNLSQMQLFVMPVTTSLLTTPNRAMDLEFQLAKERHIPVLPIMMEHGVDDMYSERFGDLQYMDPNDTDKTRRSFDEVLETYIRSVLVSDELAEKVRAAFDAYIFLSYRKKDRRKAQELMRLIHRNPLCRDIAIWYDEFLIPGEDFNQAIGKMLQRSDLFTLVVTPNLVNETNYVMTTEYPAAKEQEKPVLPVEMEETDRGQLKEHYESLPPCVRGEEDESFYSALLEKIRTMAVEVNDKDPEHNFLIGLAYLDGIDVEVDAKRALELITGAAEAGVPEAMEQLVTMYETGKGVARDYYEGVRWRERHVAFLRETYEKEPTGDRATELIKGLRFWGDALFDLEMPVKAEQVYGEMKSLSEQWVKSGENQYRRYLLISYSMLGGVAKAVGNFPGAQEYYEKSLAIAEELMEKTETVESMTDLALVLNYLGDLLREMENLSSAQNYYEKSLAIFEKLAEKTGTVRSRLELSATYILLGQTAKATGDLTEAQRYYEKSLAIVEEIWEKTGTIGAGKNLSINYEGLGDIEREKRNLAETQRYYERSLAISEQIMEKTGTIDSMRDVAIGYGKLGVAAKAMGDLPTAQMYYEKDLAISEKLVKKAGTITMKRDLAVSCMKRGDLAKAMGDLPAAQMYYKKGLAIREELYKKTGTTELGRSLASGYVKLGDIEKAMGELTYAQFSYERSFAIREKLWEKTRTLQDHKELAYILYNMGLFYYNNKIGDWRAKELFERVVKIGKNSDDDYLIKLGEKAKNILYIYF